MHDASVPSQRISKIINVEDKYNFNVIICCFIFLLAFVLMRFPNAFDRLIIRLANAYANHNQVLDRFIYDLDIYWTLSGVVFISLIWGCWFSNVERDRRARILNGTLASFGAGIISRGLQHKIDSHPRPYFDPDIAFQSPLGLGKLPYNTWDSFPSDHATVFSGLVTVIWLSGSKLRSLAVTWLILVEFARAYMGAHYPTDLIAGAALGSAIVWAVQAPWFVSVARWFVDLEKRSPATFYPVAFFVTYQIATLFWEVRDMVGGFSVLKRIL